MPDTSMQSSAVVFPGITLRRNSTQGDAVRAVQSMLNTRGCGPVQVDGVYGPATETAVRQFQSRFFDPSGLPLVIDGTVGPVTWAALFGSGSVPVMQPAVGLALKALEVAESQIGRMEVPPGSNAGPDVERYLAAVGLGPGNAWCAAFTWWCTNQAATALKGTNPLPRSGGVLDLWRRSLKAGLPCITAAEAKAHPALVTSGMLFVIDHGGGQGHTGFVKGLDKGRLATIEGNSNDGGSREGVGVFELTRRTIGNINTGFIGLP